MVESTLEFSKDYPGGVGGKVIRVSKALSHNMKNICIDKSVFLTVLDNWFDCGFATNLVPIILQRSESETIFSVQKTTRRRHRFRWPDPVKLKHLIMAAN